MMKFAAVGLAGLSALASVASAGTYPITGVQDGLVSLRMEIHTMNKQFPDTYNLYLLALQEFQAMDQTEMLSHYQVAGIHGVPNIPWNGVQANPNNGGAVGYCTHASVLFPCWHRAYLALYEQQVYTHVQNIANSFPAGSQRDRYQAAAKGFRLPYWDWAAPPPSGLPTFPYMMSNKYVTVTTPTGQQSILNPLFRYSFHPLDGNAMLSQPWSFWPTTLRWPTENNTVNTYSQDNLIQNSFSNTRVSLRNSVWNMFTQCPDYSEFSNEAASQSTPNCAGSLESIHDTVHSLCGGQNDGHMTWLWYAGHDPIFFLHHAAVDRLFAMWQVIYPNSFAQNTPSGGNSFTIANGETVGPNTGLTPFTSNTNGQFHTCNSVRATAGLNYYYPETNQGASASSVRAAAMNLYGPNSPTNSKRDVAPTNLTTTPSGAEYQYTVNIKTQRFALDGPYNIYIFMGEPDEDPSQWPFCTNMVGMYGVFSQSGMTGHNLTVSSSVILTDSLVQQVCDETSSLQSMQVDHVVPYLQSQLNWRVLTSGGAVVPNEDVPGLLVSVVTTQSMPATAPDTFPTFGDFTTLANITHGKAGGLMQTLGSDVTNFLNATGLLSRRNQLFKSQQGHHKH